MSWAQSPTEFWYMDRDVTIKGGNCSVLIKSGIWFTHIEAFLINSHWTWTAITMMSGIRETESVW